MSVRAGPLAGALLLAAACTRGAPASSGRLDVHWTGANTATFGSAASAEWCDSLQVLEIAAMRHDTGVGLAIFPGPKLESGTYPIRRRAPGDTLARPDSGGPSAAVGLRWFSRTVVRGFQGDSGQVVVEQRENGTIAGRFTASATGVYDEVKVKVSGTFTGIEVRPARRGCRRAVPEVHAPARDTMPLTEDSVAAADSATRRPQRPGVD